VERVHHSVNPALAVPQMTLINPDKANGAVRSETAAMKLRNLISVLIVLNIHARLLIQNFSRHILMIQGLLTGLKYLDCLAN
jgi:cytochrome b